MDESVESVAPVKQSKRRHRAAKPQLLDRHGLDRRTNAARTFDRLVAEITSDLGGDNQLSAIQRSLVQAYAGSVVLLANLNARILLGEVVDVAEHAHVVSSMVRLAARLGIRRRPRDVTPTVDEYLASKQEAAE
jgi:hypothetical protein